MVLRTYDTCKDVNAIVVDDDRDVLDVFLELLKINGINVIGSGANGKDAVELYQKFHPDIIFMDAVMPMYDGFYGLERIMQYDPNARVVLVTGSVNTDSKIDNCLAKAILEKPIDMTKIMDVVQKLCVH